MARTDPLYLGTPGVPARLPSSVRVPEECIISAIPHPSVVPPSPTRPRLWTATRLVPLARQRPEAVAHLALRTASPVVTDALALAATSGRLTAAELAARLTGGEVDVTDPAAMAGLALAWSGSGDPASVEHGADAYGWLLRQGQLGRLPLHHQAAGQVLYLTGRLEQLTELWPLLDRMPAPVRDDLLTDLAHPAVAGDGGRARWLQLLSAPFERHGLASISVAEEPAGLHLFDRLTTDARPGDSHGPLVTVIVPCYRPDEGLLTSITSMTAQTYADLEVLIVDDASGPEFRDLIAQAQRLDERVRVLRLDRNGGTYLARRAGTQSARGTLITTQDADDWSHPERLERQVAALEQAPSAPASRSQAIRAKDDLTHQWFGYRSLRDNASSLMVRRGAMERAGTWMPIRKSADSEYAERLAHLLGPVADTASPLAITRLRTGSLSRGDFSYQWAHPDRNAFRGTYRAWHRTLPPAGARPAPAVDDADLPEVPPPFARGLDGVITSPDRLDICLVGDLSPSPQEHPWLTPALLDALGGRAVGLWHLERPLAADRRRPEMHPDWFQRVVTDPTLHLVNRAREARITTVVVLDPDSLLVACDQPTATRADTVLVGLDERCTRPGDDGLPLDLLAVGDAVSAWWRRRPEWALSPHADPEAVRAALPGLPIEPWPWPVPPARIDPERATTGAGTVR